MKIQFKSRKKNCLLDRKNHCKFTSTLQIAENKTKYYLNFHSKMSCYVGANFDIFYKKQSFAFTCIKLIFFNVPSIGVLEPSTLSSNC